MQIARRLRAMIVNLADTLPAQRHPALHQELNLLDRMIGKLYAPHNAWTHTLLPFRCQKLPILEAFRCLFVHLDAFRCLSQDRLQILYSCGFAGFTEWRP